MPSISAHRKTEPARLAPTGQGRARLDRDEALEKDRSRRYETANGFDATSSATWTVTRSRLVPQHGIPLPEVRKETPRKLVTGASFVLLLIAASVFRYVSSGACQCGTSAGRGRAAPRRPLRITAEANFQKAREAVDEYFTKVSESKLLNVPGLQPLRKELLESSRKYYQEFLKDHDDDPSVRAEAAEAWYRVGFVTMDLNSGKEAIESFQKATEMYEQLARDHPSVERYTYKLAMCLNDLGNQQSALGLEPDARRSHDRCLAIRQQIVRDHPDVPEYQKELGIGYGVWAARQDAAGRTTSRWSRLNADAKSLSTLSVSIPLRPTTAGACLVHSTTSAVSNAPSVVWPRA